MGPRLLLAENRIGGIDDGDCAGECRELFGRGFENQIREEGA
jgi:hypothetical protein